MAPRGQAETFFKDEELSHVLTGDHVRGCIGKHCDIGPGARPCKRGAHANVVGKQDGRWRLQTAHAAIMEAF